MADRAPVEGHRAGGSGDRDRGGGLRGRGLAGSRDRSHARSRGVELVGHRVDVVAGGQRAAGGRRGGIVERGRIDLARIAGAFSAAQFVFWLNSASM